MAEERKPPMLQARPYGTAVAYAGGSFAVALAPS